MSLFNANLKITKSKVKNGELVDLEINGQNIELGSEVPMDANKAQTINVSTYTEPVAINPSSGKKGMKKATVTLSNIPEIEATKAVSIDVSTYTEPIEITPTEGKDGVAKVIITLTNIPAGE